VNKKARREPRVFLFEQNRLSFVLLLGS
jgi:hypothetical protein